MSEHPLDLKLLRAFSPLDGLRAENLHALARKTVIRKLDSGRVLFKEGDSDKRTFYLVSARRRAMPSRLGSRGVSPPGR